MSTSVHRALLPLMVVAFNLLAGAVSIHSAEARPNIIFDTDMGGDCDDVGALFMLHGAVERGEITLLATMGCISSEAIAPAIDAINTWFGRPEIPVGTLKDLGFHADPGYPAELVRRYPHKFATGKEYPDAVVLYRQILAKQPDGSVTVVAVGMLRNIANLLKSAPDAASPLDGRALVAKKVKRLDLMGGKYPPSPSRNDQDGEYNFVEDAPSTALVCSTWPTPILFNGEGGSTNSGRRVTYEMPEHNPLSMAYRNYPGVGYAGDRLSWDPVSCLVTVRGAAPWFKIVSGGVNVADAKTGINRWQDKPADGVERGHSYLVAVNNTKPACEKALEDLMVAGKGRPTNLRFNTAYYANAGMCQITSKSANTDVNTAAIKAFDGDERTVWQDQSVASWIQCQYVDGRKYLVTSYVLLCKDANRLPRTVELQGSNDGGTTWTSLDNQSAPGFTGSAPRREFAIAKPAKWNAYRVVVTATNEREGIQVSEIELNELITCTPKLAVASVTIDQKTLSIPMNGRATVSALLAPLNTWEREVTWTSSDPAVAEVRRIGEQLAMVVGKKPGTCTITATCDQQKHTCAVTVTASSLPNGWSYDELNTPPIPGAIEVTNDSFRLTGCGHAMTSWWQRLRDQGTFVSQPLIGTSVLTARLTSIAPQVGGPSYQWDHRPPSTAGLMIREALGEACPRHVLIQVEATGKLTCRWRFKSGDPDDGQHKDLGLVTLPIYLKIAQVGKDIQVFTSTDGKNWGEPRMSHTASFDDKSRIGMFVCSGNTFAATSAVFDGVALGK
jgi:Inosine-uridine preferring nucleoside hydrolase/Bacterial Ig-like domain (group 2)/F5/8 type C domain